MRQIIYNLRQAQKEPEPGTQDSHIAFISREDPVRADVWRRAGRGADLTEGGKSHVALPFHHTPLGYPRVPGNTLFAVEGVRCAR